MGKVPLRFPRLQLGLRPEFVSALKKEALCWAAGKEKTLSAQFRFFFSSDTIFARLLLLKIILPLFLVNAAAICKIFICSYLASYLYPFQSAFHLSLRRTPHFVEFCGWVITDTHLPLQAPPMETHRTYHQSRMLVPGIGILSNVSKAGGNGEVKYIRSGRRAVIRIKVVLQ